MAFHRLRARNYCRVKNRLVIDLARYLVGLLDNAIHGRTRVAGYKYRRGGKRAFARDGT
jgi:hypothetical protein